MATRILLAGLLLLGACKSAPPSGEPGPAADALAEAMQAAVGATAWEQTGAVQWVFKGDNHHLWDRRRHLAWVAWDDKRAVIDIDARIGVAFRGETRLTGEAAADALDDAHAKWTNDAFWLNPVMKAFDPGTVRSQVAPNEDGQVGLLVRYQSGGRTPGDAYLWRLGPDHRPVSWQMWTSNIPVGGLEASWEGWTELETGAWVSTKHELPVFTLELTEVAGAETVEGLREDVPFAALDACKKAGDCDEF